MAVATTTALAIAGIAASAGSAGMSFAQASKQRKLQRQAESDAAKAMAEARKKLDVNFYEALGIQKEPYELEREALISAGAQAVEAGRESERGAAAVAGRVQAQQQMGQRQIAAAMGQELMDLEKLTAGEESRLRDIGVELDLGEVAGAQLAQREAANMEAAAMQQGMASATSALSQGLSLVPLYGKTAGAKQLGDISKMGMDAGMNQQQFQNTLAALGKSNPEYAALAGVGAMDPMKFQDYMTQLGPQYLRGLGKDYGKLLNTEESLRRAGLIWY